MQFDFSQLLTVAGLTSAASALIALVFILVPPARAWFESLDGEIQRAVNGVIIVVIGAGVAGASCVGLTAVVACTANDLVSYFVSVVFAAVIALGVTKAEYGIAQAFYQRRVRARSIGAAPHTTKLIG
jgi:hypothetical protein